MSELRKMWSMSECVNPVEIEEGDLAAYHYAIRSPGDGSETLLHTTVFFDGGRCYEFHAAIPPVAEEEYTSIVASFRRAGGN